jgi:hypothetical protein
MHPRMLPENAALKAHAQEDDSEADHRSEYTQVTKNKKKNKDSKVVVRRCPGPDGGFKALDLILFVCGRQVKALAEPGWQASLIRFMVTPIDAPVAQYVVHYFPVMEPIRSRKVSSPTQPVAVLGLTNHTKYGFRVCTIDASGVTHYNDTTVRTTPPGAAKKPPRGLQGTPIA